MHAEPNPLKKSPVGTNESKVAQSTGKKMEEEGAPVLKQAQTQEDSDLEREARRVITQASDLPVADFKVTARDGEVTLWGSMASQEAVQRATALVERVSGAKSVITKLRVDAEGPKTFEVPGRQRATTTSARQNAQSIKEEDNGSIGHKA